MEEDSRGGQLHSNVLGPSLIISYKLILPYLELDIKYFDLGLEYRDQV